MDGDGVVANVGEEGGRGEGAEVGGDSAGVALGVFAAAFGGGRLGRHCLVVVDSLLVKVLSDVEDRLWIGHTLC